MNSNSAFSFFLGWSVIIAMYWGFLKYEGTRTIIYYVAWLAVILTVVAHYKELQSILSDAGFSTVGTIANEQSDRQPQTPTQTTSTIGLVNTQPVRI